MSKVISHPRRPRSTKKRPPVASHEDSPKTAHRSRANVAVAGMDKPLLYVTLALSVLGLATVYSASAMEAMDKYGSSLYFVQRQLVFFIAGFGLMYAVSRFPFMYWSRFTKLLALGVIGLLVYTLANGVEAYGAERWIRIAGVQFQPSELGKVSVVLLLAQALGHKLGERQRLGFLINLGLIGMTVLLIYKQPSLSMTVILSVVSAGVMWIAGIPVWILGSMGVLGGSYVVYKLLHTEYQLRRIQGWLDPWKDAQDTGYNLIQSLYAIGSGGLLGVGLGMSHQKLYYLPFQYTDFIFSVWAEEWGLVGCVFLMGLFVTLLYRGYVIARTCRSSYGQLLAMGITLMLGVQVVINLAVATGLFPVTGVTLPLISYGGTSVLVTLVMIGILFNISRYRVTVSTLSPTHETP